MILSLLASFALPVFLWAAATSPDTVTAAFDDGTIQVKIAPLPPGECRTVEIEHGNNKVTTEVWGYNNALPQVLINEFSTRGDKRNPDRTELYILQDGNLNGLTLSNGKEQHTFPSTPVSKGDYIVYRWETGLSANNGKIQLRRDPSLWSDELDSIEYSDKPDKADAISSAGTSATRTFCRRAGADGRPVDTDSPQDWYITVTKGQTFGFSNNPAEYSPPVR